MRPLNFSGAYRPRAYSMLAIKGEHATKVIKLPPLHKDPFDRMSACVAPRSSIISARYLRNSSGLDLARWQRNPATLTIRRGPHDQVMILHYSRITVRNQLQAALRPQLTQSCQSRTAVIRKRDAPNRAIFFIDVDVRRATGAGVPDASVTHPLDRDAPTGR